MVIIDMKQVLDICQIFDLKEKSIQINQLTIE